MPIYTYTTLDDPSADNTQAFGINASGQIVGFYNSGSSFHGFLLSGGTYTPLDDPLATGATHAFGINTAGQIVGDYVNASGTHGFLLSGGIYTTLNDPSATSGTVAFGINATGQIVGYYSNASGTHGFRLSGGSYTRRSLDRRPRHRCTGHQRCRPDRRVLF
jgi:probable HAF family extracellular repeat protein